MSRPELQQVAKDNGIKANLSSEGIVKEMEARASLAKAGRRDVKRRKTAQSQNYRELSGQRSSTAGNRNGPAGASRGSRFGPLGDLDSEVEEEAEEEDVEFPALISDLARERARASEERDEAAKAALASERLAKKEARMEAKRAAKEAQAQAELQEAEAVLAVRLQAKKAAKKSAGRAAEEAQVSDAHPSDLAVRVQAKKATKKSAGRVAEEAQVSDVHPTDRGEVVADWIIRGMYGGEGLPVADEEGFGEGTFERALAEQKFVDRTLLGFRQAAIEMGFTGEAVDATLYLLLVHCEGGPGALLSLGDLLSVQAPGSFAAIAKLVGDSEGFARAVHDLWTEIRDGGAGSGWPRVFDAYTGVGRKEIGLVIALFEYAISMSKRVGLGGVGGGSPRKRPRSAGGSTRGADAGARVASGRDFSDSSEDSEEDQWGDDSDSLAGAMASGGASGGMATARGGGSRYGEGIKVTTGRGTLTLPQEKKEIRAL